MAEWKPEDLLKTTRPLGPGESIEGEGAHAVIVRVCELCGGRAIERHCKVQCTNCGFQRDCSDP